MSSSTRHCAAIDHCPLRASAASMLGFIVVSKNRRFDFLILKDGSTAETFFGVCT